MTTTYAWNGKSYVFSGQALDEHSIPLASAPRLSSWLHQGCIVRATSEMEVRDILFPYAAWSEGVFTVPKPRGTGCETFFTLAWNAENGGIERESRMVASAADRDLMHATVEHARKLGKHAPAHRAYRSWGLRDSDSDGVVAQYGSLITCADSRYPITNRLPAFSAGYATQLPDTGAVDPAVRSILDIFAAFGDEAGAAVFGTTALSPVSVGDAPVAIRGGQGDSCKTHAFTPAYPLGEALFGGHSRYPGLHIKDTYPLVNPQDAVELLVENCGWYGGAPVIVKEICAHTQPTGAFLGALGAAHRSGVNVLIEVGDEGGVVASAWDLSSLLSREDQILLVSATGNPSTMTPHPIVAERYGGEVAGTDTRSAMFSAWLAHLCRVAADLGGVRGLRSRVENAVRERKGRMLVGGAPDTPRTDTLAHAYVGLEMFCDWAAAYSSNAEELHARGLVALDALTLPTV